MKTFTNLIVEIRSREDKISLTCPSLIDAASHMTLYLQELLLTVKEKVIKNGFSDEIAEIHFFRNTKPFILGKLLYYNKVFRLEASCPVSNGKVYKRFFSQHLKILTSEYRERICYSDFYKYYRSGRTDRDNIYFKLGEINYFEGLNSFVFEVDKEFSTYYDYKVARIISNENLYSYLLSKLSSKDYSETFIKTINESDIKWTDSKNALIELIYALYVSNVISNGGVTIRQITTIFEIVFNISLGDIHHSFHRMKTRSESRVIFLDRLKTSLLEHMEKNL